MTAADGLFIDQAQHLLYVGQLFSATVFVWNIDPTLPTPKFIGILPGLSEAASYLDDFTLAFNGSAVVGCDWTLSKLVKFPALLTNDTFKPVVLVDATAGIHTPTSARWGEDAHSSDPFPSSSLFVTEGRARDYVLKESHDRLLRIDF
jgi:hypothetical protein